VSRDFRPQFFHQSIPTWVPIHGLQPFCIWHPIRRENRQYSNFGGVIDPDKTILVGSMTRLKVMKLFLWNCFTKLRNFATIQKFQEKLQQGETILAGSLTPAKTISAQSLTTLERIQRGFRKWEVKLNSLIILSHGLLYFRHSELRIWLKIKMAIDHFSCQYAGMKKIPFTSLLSSWSFKQCKI
jgi:hypothetical protein